MRQRASPRHRPHHDIGAGRAITQAIGFEGQHGAGAGGEGGAIGCCAISSTSDGGFLRCGGAADGAACFTSTKGLAQLDNAAAALLFRSGAQQPDQGAAHPRGIGGSGAGSMKRNDVIHWQSPDSAAR